MHIYNLLLPGLISTKMVLDNPYMSSVRYAKVVKVSLILYSILSFLYSLFTCNSNGISYATVLQRERLKSTARLSQCTSSLRTPIQSRRRVVSSNK